MPINGLSHVTLLVRDLSRSATLWTEGLGAQEVYDSGAQSFSLSPERFFLLGPVWIALMQGEPVARSYRHIAFSVADDELDGFEQRLRQLGAEIRPPRPRVPGEGRSLYFYDFDDNLLELHSGTLEQRLARYRNAPAG